MNINKIDNSYIRLLLNDLSVAEVLSTLNIEDIDDHTTKVICRTIIGSIDALHEHINSNQMQELQVSS
jgi:hypothetical protein